MDWKAQRSLATKGARRCASKSSTSRSMRASALARAPLRLALSMTLIAYLTLSLAPLSLFRSATTTTPKAPRPTIRFGAKSDGEKGCSDKVRSDPPLGGGGGRPARLAARTLGGVGTAGKGARDVFFFSFAGDLNIAANLPARDFRFCGGGLTGVLPSKPRVPLRLGAGAGAGDTTGDAIETRREAPGDANWRSGDSSFFSSSTPASPIVCPPSLHPSFRRARSIENTFYREHVL